MPIKRTDSLMATTNLNRVKLIRGGHEYFRELLQLINQAQESIHIQTYIYDDDYTGRMVAEALKEAVKRNVAVYLMADGYASQVMSRAFIDELLKAGIHFRFFETIFKSRHFYFGRRLHHKVTVADSRYAIVGGINISNNYNDMPGKPAWLDFALLVEGQAAKELCILCWNTWQNYPAKMSGTPCTKEQISFNIAAQYLSAVTIRRNDWVRRKNEITGTYIRMLRNANSQVTILCSYFLPGRIIRKQIEYAIKRGVTIRVIAAGHSDVMLAKYAERWLYDWLLRKGIELYEYQKNILHGKIAVCDDQWMTIGSYNINNISTYASIELNLNVYNPVFALEVRKTLEEILNNDCTRITAEDHKKTNNIFIQFARWLAYQFIRMVFYLFTFYFKHKT